jgi:hypothetical protein
LRESLKGAPSVKEGVQLNACLFRKMLSMALILYLLVALYPGKLSWRLAPHFEKIVASLARKER